MEELKFDIDSLIDKFDEMKNILTEIHDSLDEQSRLADEIINK